MTLKWWEAIVNFIDAKPVGSSVIDVNIKSVGTLGDSHGQGGMDPQFEWGGCLMGIGGGPTGYFWWGWMMGDISESCDLEMMGFPKMDKFDGLCNGVRWLSGGDGIDGWCKWVMWLSQKGNFLMTNPLILRSKIAFLGNFLFRQLMVVMWCPNLEIISKKGNFLGGWFWVYFPKKEISFLGKTY